jgi:hypothetical protein
MSDQTNLGPPDLKIAGLQLWVHGLAYPEASDYHDGNWLRITAYCGAKGATVQVQGALLMITDIRNFAEQCAAMYDRSSGSAVLDPLEPELKISLEVADALGHIRAQVDITPDHLMQSHWMEFELDQSYLPDIIKQCVAIGQEYPVRGLA